MKFNRLDRVKREVKHTFWDGFVLGYIQTLHGLQIVAVERPDHQLFFCAESELQLIARASQACRHDRGFRFRPGHLPGWECNLGCGYNLNFNPDFRDGIAYLSEPKAGPTIELKPSKF